MIVSHSMESTKVFFSETVTKDFIKENRRDKENQNKENFLNMHLFFLHGRSIVPSSSGTHFINLSYFHGIITFPSHIGLHTRLRLFLFFSCKSKLGFSWQVNYSGVQGGWRFLKAHGFHHIKENLMIVRYKNSFIEYLIRPKPIMSSRALGFDDVDVFYK